MAIFDTQAPDYHAPAIPDSTKQALEQGYNAVSSSTPESQTQSLLKGTQPNLPGGDQFSSYGMTSTGAVAQALSQRAQKEYDNIFGPQKTQAGLEGMAMQAKQLGRAHSHIATLNNMVQAAAQRQIMAEQNKIAARNGIIKGIMGGAGAVGGALLGGPMGAMAGAQIGSAFGPKGGMSAPDKNQQIIAPQEGGGMDEFGG